MSELSRVDEAERACQEAQEALERAKQIVERSKALLRTSCGKTVPQEDGPQLVGSVPAA